MAIFHRCLRDEERAHNTRVPATLQWGQIPSEFARLDSETRNLWSPPPLLECLSIVPDTQVCSYGKAGNPEEVVTVGTEL